MRARIQKWGNSLALRIPKSFAIEAGIQQETPVELSLNKGRLVVTPLYEHSYTLEQLLSGINDQNIHNEIDMGPAAGKEIW